MKTGFKEVVKLETKPKNIKSPWNFDAPPYDKRSSCFVSAGTDHGVGHKNPVGTMGKTTKYDIPLGKVKTLDVYSHGQSVQVED